MSPNVQVISYPQRHKLSNSLWQLESVPSVQIILGLVGASGERNAATRTSVQVDQMQSYYHEYGVDGYWKVYIYRLYSRSLLYWP